MNLGWKWLIPIALVWVMLISTVRIARAESWLSNPLVIGALVVAVVALFLLWWLLDREPEPLPEEPAGTFDAFAGGYPVPPMPGQRLPELADVVPSGVDAERTDA
jgi:NADH-quinone oxidoreductase subunit H